MIRAQDQLQAMLRIGRVFSSGATFSEVFSIILHTAMDVLNAEGGSLYIHDDVSDTLKLVFLVNNVLGVDKAVEDFDPLRIDGIMTLPIYDNAGNPDHQTVAVEAFFTKELVNIGDVYNHPDNDFLNVKKFDKENDYRTHSMIAIPLVTHEQKAIGVIQIVNYDASLQNADSMSFVQLLASQMGVTLSNILSLYALQNLLTDFVSMIGIAIDKKSPHTAGHCQRVTEVTIHFARMLNESSDPPFSDFYLDEQEMRELRIAALLHDVGKIITPVHVLEKSTRLMGVHDKIESVAMRAELLRAQSRLDFLKKELEKRGEGELWKLAEALDPVDDEQIELLQQVNDCRVFCTDEIAEKIRQIAKWQLRTSSGAQPLLSDEDLSSLLIPRGTLNPQERKIIEDHASISISLLSSLPWPKGLRQIVEYAGGHHENVNGTGYPNGLVGDEMSTPALILGIADRFEGLAAPDRPYRQPLKLSRVLDILKNMCRDGEIDADLFNFFMTHQVYRQYADTHLPEELCDC